MGQFRGVAARLTSGKGCQAQAVTFTAVILGILLLMGCGRPTPPPLILLISFDTFRADALGVLTGMQPSLTPNLDQLAADSVLFENSFAHYPQTLPSHMSMVTGVYPGVHRVTPKNHRTHDGGSLPQGIATLPELLRQAGYRTVGLVTTEWLKAEFGFGRGFDHYERLPHKLTYADRVSSAALNKLDASAEDERPLFLFLHFYDAHSDFTQGRKNKFPYYSPPAYREDLGTSDDGREFCDEQGRCDTQFLMAADTERRSFPDTEVRNILDLYRAGIKYLDAEVGPFLAELRTRELYDNAMIVVTSDHGEEFREHGRFIHSQPYDETIRVPLLVKFPRSWRAGSRVAGVVETIDILPTILEYAGFAVPDHVQGKSLIGLIGREASGGLWVISQDSIRTSRYCLRTARSKFIIDLEGSSKELYDLDADPEERVNIISERPGLAEQLERKLIRTILANRRLGEEFGVDKEGSPDVLSEEERETLKALGYLN